jgi:hypothetical protein
VTAHHGTADPRPVPPDTSPARLHGEACIECGATDPPLRPAGQVVTAGTAGVSRVWDVVRCWRDRHEVAQLAPDDQGRRLWGIRNWHDNGRWVDNGGDVERHAMQHLAEQWVRARRGVDEAHSGSAQTQPPPVRG